MKKLIAFIFVIAIVSLYGSEVFAAGMGMGPPGPPCGVPPFPPCPVPIDGGISLLAGVGILFGGKKIYDTHKKNLD